MSAIVRLLGAIHDDLRLDLAAVAAAFIVPDETPQSFSPYQSSPQGTAASVDPAGSAGDPDGPGGTTS